MLFYNLFKVQNGAHEKSNHSINSWLYKYYNYNIIIKFIKCTFVNDVRPKR